MEVNIRVLDQNDNPPTFSQQHYYFQVKEDAAQPGYPIVDRFYVTDKDVQVRLSTLAKNVTKGKRLNRLFYQTMTMQKYVVFSLCKCPKLEHCRLFTIVRLVAIDILLLVSYANVFILSVCEIFQRKNNYFEFELSGEESKYFAIDKKTGRLTINSTLDYEKQINYTFYVSRR